MTAHIHFSLADLTQREAKAIQVMLGTLFTEAETLAPVVQEPASPVIEAVVEPTTEPVKEEAPAVQEATFEPKTLEVPKKTRGEGKPKPVKEEAPAPAPAPAPKPKPEPVKEEAKPEAEALTLEDARKALNNYKDKNGFAAAVELLKDFGVDRIGAVLNLPEAEQKEFMRLASNA